MWPIDDLRAPQWIEQQSPRMRALLAFGFFTLSFLFATRGFGRPLAESLFDSVFAGAVMAGLMLLRDRRRARRDAESQLPHSR